VSLLKEARTRATVRAKVLEQKLAELQMPPPRQLLTELRSYLLQQRDINGHPGNQVESELTVKKSADLVLMNLGPTTSRGHEPAYVLASKAKLSFGITVVDERQCSRMISYRFDYRNDSVDEFRMMRFDLSRQAHSDCLIEPQAHLHAGLEGLRIPSYFVNPFEILDLIFFVVDPQIKRHSVR